MIMYRGRKPPKRPNQCQYTNCGRDKMKPSEDDGWSYLGLCQKHVDDAKEFLKA